MARLKKGPNTAIAQEAAQNVKQCSGINIEWDIENRVNNKSVEMKGLTLSLIAFIFNFSDSNSRQYF